MKINKNIKLSSNDITGLIKSLNKLSNTLKDANNTLTKDIAEDGLNVLNNFYSKSFDENIEPPDTYIKKLQNGYSIVAHGKDIVYEEFGTGDEGAKDGHPWKGQTNFKLNAYNSGSHIRDANESSKEHNITSGKYWTYAKNGNIIYTQGVPSGKELYRTIQYLRDEGINKIVNEKVRDTISKL